MEQLLSAGRVQRVVRLMIPDKQPLLGSSPMASALLADLLNLGKLLGSYSGTSRLDAPTSERSGARNSVAWSPIVCPKGLHSSGPIGHNISSSLRRHRSVGTGAVAATRDHVADPTTTSSDHSREYAPVCVVGGGVGRLGDAEEMASVGRTVAAHLRVNLDPGFGSVLAGI